MVRILRKPVWAVVACAALAAQGVPQASGDPCESGCCGAAVQACCPVCPAETAAPPCRCRLDARQEQPLAVRQGASPDRDLLDQVAVAEWTSPEAPRALGVSREYAAASLSIPIRPVRILRGVWRN